MSLKKNLFKVVSVINRPGVAGVVLKHLHH